MVTSLTSVYCFIAGDDLESSNRVVESDTHNLCYKHVTEVNCAVAILETAYAMLCNLCTVTFGCLLFHCLWHCSHV